MAIRTRERVGADPVPGSSRTEYAVDSGPVTRWLPGIVAGLVGFAVFLILHAVWILPIWFVVPFGTIVAAIGGATAGWAFAVVKPSLPTGVLGRWVAVGTGAILALTPTMILVWLGEPYVPVVDGVVQSDAIDLPSLAVRFFVELVVVTAAAGATLGWLLTRRRRGALAVSVASLAFAIGPGHNLPFFDLTTQPGATKTGLLLLLAAVVSASGALVVVDRVLETRRER